MRARRFSSDPHNHVYNFREFNLSANASSRKPRLVFMQSGSQEIITEGSIFRNGANKHFDTQISLNQERKTQQSKRQENAIVAAKQNNVVYLKKNL